MKKIFEGPAWLYVIIINLPTVVFLILWFEYGQPMVAFIIFVVIDPFIYRPVMDYRRLAAMGKIEEGDYREITKWATISYRFKYYGSLMFGS